MNSFEIFIIISTTFLFGVSIFLVYIAKKEYTPLSNGLYRICTAYYKNEILWIYILIFFYIFYSIYIFFRILTVEYETGLLLINLFFLSIIALSLSWKYFNKSIIDRYEMEYKGNLKR